MRLRKFIFFLLFLGLIPFACWKPKYPYYQIDEIALASFRDLNLEKKVAATDSIGADSVFIQVNLSTRVIAQHFNWELSSALMATTKPHDGSYGLKDGIDAINLTSDNTFDGRPPGTNLNDLALWAAWKNFKSVSELIGKLNADEYQQVVLYLTNKPGNNLKHTLTLELVYTSGKRQSAQTALTWK
jgi:hypothetical protein